MGNNKSSLKKVLILVSILAVPGFLYFLLQEKGKNRYRPLGIFGPKELASTFHNRRGEKVPDTIYHEIRDFELTNQEGKRVGLPADTTQITVVNFFFSKCRASCSQMNREMARVVDLYQGNRLVKFYSISLDPAYDTPEVLARYAKQFNVPAEKWNFLTGDRELIYKLAVNDFLVDAFPDSLDQGKIVHSSFLILVDPLKRIRGYYDVTQKEQVDKLIDEIKVQIAEELRKVADR